MGPSPGSCSHTWKCWAFLPLLLTTCAGSLMADDSRVLGGEPCAPHSQPWQAALFQGAQLLCAGVLVAPQWVLTAAHCKKPKYTVHLGEQSLQNHEGSEQEFKVARSIPHPCHNESKGNSHDLMLLRLQRPVNVNSQVKPIGLPSHCSQPAQKCIVSGWGTTTSPRVGQDDFSIPAPVYLISKLQVKNGVVKKIVVLYKNETTETFPDILQCAELNIWPQDRCEQAYPDKISDVMVCAGDENGVDTCQGDSGGPLVCDGVLQGITSWGADPCGRPEKPGVYTRVCRYTEWIKKIINSNRPLWGADRGGEVGDPSPSINE